MTGISSKVSCFDRLFDISSDKEYNMSIRLQSDGLVFSVHNAETLQFIGFESVPLNGMADMYKHIAGHDLLKMNFNKTVVIVPTTKYTIIPTALFIEHETKEYFGFVHFISPDEELKVVNLLSDEAKLIYATHKGYINIVNDFFPSACVVPGIAAFVNMLFRRFRNNLNELLFLNLYKDSFDIVYFSNGRLKFCNNFNCKSAEDIVYFTIFVIDQLKINQEKAEVNLCGNIDSKSPVYKLLKKYIKKVQTLKTDENINISYALNDVETVKYLDLFNTRLCEL